MPPAGQFVALTAVITLTSLMFGMNTAQAEKVYVYLDDSGNRLITNAPSNRAGIKLLKVYEPVASIRSVPNRRNKSAVLGFNKARTLAPVASVYDPIIQRLADQYQQDRALIKAIVHVESSFNTYAVSPKGALGLMQLMPGTAQRFHVDDPFNADDNINGGTRYFSQLMQRYENDVRKALAAYNAGEKAVDDYGDIPPYPETQAYVESVLNLHRQYQDQHLQQAPVDIRVLGNTIDKINS